MESTVQSHVSMKTVIPRIWWLIMLRGLAGILLGFALFSQSNLNLRNVAIFMGLYWLIDGIFMSVASFILRRADEKWWIFLLRGLIGLVAAVIVFNQLPAPGDTASRGVITILSAFAILNGLVDIVASSRIRQVLDDEWAILLGGALNMIFGVLIFFSPQFSLRVVGPVIAGFAMIGGIGMIFFANRLRNLRHKA